MIMVNHQHHVPKCHICNFFESFWGWWLPLPWAACWVLFFFFPIKITLDEKSSAVLFERANSKLQTTIFHCSVRRQLCVFTNTEQKPTRCAHSYLHQCRCPAVATAEMHLSLCWHALFGFHSCLAGVGGIFSLRGGICFHTFPSYVLPCQTPFWQAAPLLPSTTQQQNAMGYRREVLFTKAD